MHCPKCAGDMASQLFKDEFSYYVCVKCSGRWVGGAVLHDHCASLFCDGENTVFKHFMNLPVKTTTINCPGCLKKNLTLVNIKGTEVEFCLGCHGVYFDLGEMLEALPKGKFTLRKEDDSDVQDVVDGVIDEVADEGFFEVLSEFFSH